MMRLTLFYFAFQKKKIDSFSILLNFYFFFVKSFREKFQRFETKMSKNIHQLVRMGDFEGVKRALEVNANLVLEKNSVG